jgi:uncharacterized protein involved in exopolysaccharide biosynthesis
MTDSSKDNVLNQSGNVNKISIFDIIAIITRQRRLIFTLFLIGSIIVLSIVLITKIMPPTWKINFMPDFYEPKVQVSIQESKSSLISKASSTSSIVSLLTKGGGTAQNPNLELAQIILDGYLVPDKIADEFNFIKKYGITNENHELAKLSARSIFNKNIIINTGKNASSTMFAMMYHDIDSDFATKVLNRTVELLEERFRELTSFQISLRKTFIEERLVSTEKDLKDAQNKIVQFDLKHGVVDISSQAKEQTSLMADISADLIKKELELKSLLDYFPENSTKVILLKKEIEKKKELIEQIKNGLPGSSIDVIPQNKIPSLTAEYLNLKGELEIQTKIYSMLREQLELVKIDENDNSQIFQIIEPAEILQVKSGPRRAFLVLVGIVASLILSIVIAFIFDFIVRLMKLPSEARKWDEIKKMLQTKKKGYR